MYVILLFIIFLLFHHLILYGYNTERNNTRIHDGTSHSSHTVSSISILLRLVFTTSIKKVLQVLPYNPNIVPVKSTVNYKTTS